MKENILVIGPLPPPTGGMATIVDQMKRTYLKEYQIKVFNVSKNKWVKSNILSKYVHFLFSCIKLSLIILKENPPIIHIHTASGKSFVQNAIYQNIAKIFGKKTILHMHGAEFRKWYEAANAPTQAKIRNSLQKADIILALSPVWKTYYKRLVSNKTIIEIPNSVPDINNKKYKRIYPHTEKIILFVGNICQRKGAYDLIKSISTIKDRNMKFVFIGPYEDGEKFFLTVKRLNIEDKCIFVGELSHKQIYKYYASSDVFILPSYDEGLPLSILEAMSFGLPIISTKVGSIPEVIERDNGILINAGDIQGIHRAIHNIIKNRKNIPYYHNNITKVRQKYSQKSFLKRLVKIYGQLI